MSLVVCNMLHETALLEGSILHTEAPGNNGNKNRFNIWFDLNSKGKQKNI